MRYEGARSAGQCPCLRQAWSALLLLQCVKAKSIRMETTFARTALGRGSSLTDDKGDSILTHQFDIVFNAMFHSKLLNSQIHCFLFSVHSTFTHQHPSAPKLEKFS